MNQFTDQYPAQLNRLKIVSTFPDIIQVADDLHHSYNEDQLNCVLTTFDMHQVIAKCILAHCVFKSDTRSFFHEFNSCQKMHSMCVVFKESFNYRYCDNDFV
ncbi:hypothetical protein B9Z55_023922 [Caenorhabditis nigoni]|uniref:Uncharacterized protein n=1 Tax=Caenorhabditis nigoni TaxID=1611254 RepID=A0A2G5SSC7_9PELO|nr:hypothetical protein B9Z55_023920 [Caenorhabditis nigoni]PIC17817.1 hypothetical protein B9Z55_023922 [Caenorhabditis nigoni]